MPQLKSFSKVSIPIANWESMMTSTHVTKVDSAKACSALCVASSVSATCDIFAWKKGTCHIGSTTLDDQTVVSGSTSGDNYEVYIMKGKSIILTFC